MENNTNEVQAKPAKVWRRKNIHLVSEENDIKFRGPLSYRHLRALGWICLALAQLGSILGMAANAGLVSINGAFLGVIQSANSLMTPLFLFAAFAQVLTAKNGYRKLLIVYGAGAIGIYLLFLFAYFYFFVSLINSITRNWSAAFASANAIMGAVSVYGGLSINIFIDLILCTLVTFFINYRPTRYFQGKKISIFRALVALPILYELGSITIKILASSEVMTLPALLIPLLTTKPPVAFFIFIALALFVKNRERFYLKKGKTHEEYKAFLQTNVNRLHFSLFLVSAIVGAVIIDIILFVVVLVLKLSIAGVPEIDNPEVLNLLLNSVYGLGFGKCVPMVFLIPVVIFFDYTKTYTNKIIDIAIPAAGLGLLVIIYVIGLFEILKGYIGLLGDKISDIIDDKSPEELFHRFRN